MKMDLISEFIKFTGQTAGRDKLCRVFQYGSKFGWWFIDSRLADKADLVKKLKSLEYNISTTRKLLRVGKSFDLFYGALKSIHLNDTVLRLSITISRINQALYLLLDHLLWAGRAGLVDIDAKKWGDRSARFWVVTIILNLVRNLYDICNIISHEFKVSQNSHKRALYVNGGQSDLPARQKTSLQVLQKCFVENKPVVVDTIKNGCDVFLPLSSLGHVTISPGTQGLLGVISSLCGVAVVWNPLLKLVP